MSDDAIISIRKLTKRFPGVMAVDAVSFDIRPNEFFALLGPSGCGKTTLLRMIAGLEMPSAGEIRIDGQDMARTPANRRPVNMVFQSYAVFPHMTVEDNVGYGLKVVGTPRSEIALRVKEALHMVRLEEQADRKPDQLSGGQRQRVALARALIKRPKVLLLDEPLSALDAKLREQMRLELTRLQHAVGITFIIVTHDQDEALSMADRIAVMDDGRVRQIASPTTLYEQPASRFVADFIGKVNILDGEVISCANGTVAVDTRGLGRLEIDHSGTASGPVSVAVRPEKLRVWKSEPENEAIRVAGRVRDVAYYGNASHVFIEVGEGFELSANVQNQSRRIEGGFHAGDAVWISWSPDDTLLLTE